MNNQNNKEQEQRLREADLNIKALVESMLITVFRRGNNNKTNESDSRRLVSDNVNYMIKKFNDIILEYHQPDNKAVDFTLNLFGNYCVINGIKLTDSNKVAQVVIDFLNSEYYKPYLSTPQKTLSDGDAGAVALKILENVNPKLNDKEATFFVAGFQECNKYLQSSQSLRSNQQEEIDRLKKELLDTIKRTIDLQQQLSDLNKKII